MVPITVQKEVNPAEKQTAKTPYQHPNYKRQFDQQQGQNEHTQKSYAVRQAKTSNQHTKQQTRRTTPQSHQIAPMKIDLGWTTSATMRHFFFGIRNSYRRISSSVTNTKRKDIEMMVQKENQT